MEDKLVKALEKISTGFIEGGRKEHKLTVDIMRSIATEALEDYYGYKLNKS